MYEHGAHLSKDCTDDGGFLILLVKQVLVKMDFSEELVLHLIRYYRSCSAYDQFVYLGRLLKNELLLQGFQQFCSKSAFCKLWGPYSDLICKYNVSLIRLYVVWHVSYWSRELVTEGLIDQLLRVSDLISGVCMIGVYPTLSLVPSIWFMK